MIDLRLGDLRLTIDEGGVLRIGTAATPDWLGPGRLLDAGATPDPTPSPAPAGDGVVRLGPTTQLVAGTIATRDQPGSAVGLTLGLEATATTATAPAAEGYADVVTGVRFAPAARATGSWPAGMTAFGHQATEFGLPTRSGESLDRWFLLPFRPNVVWPMWLCDPDGPAILLAPLDTFHDQVLVVPTGDEIDDRAGTLAWGWHGDLDRIPAGTTATLGVFHGESPRTLLDTWVSCLEVAPRLPVDHDTLGRQVSYWTDNGAAYWYRTEPRPDGSARTVTETLVDAVESVEAAGVAVGAVQIDSWFYPHESTRPFDTDEWVVPPSGLIDWAPRADILPDGLGPLRAGLDERPLVAHCRHLSAQSPRVGPVECWIDGSYAHPVGVDHYEDLLDRAVSWGVETFEHDWLVECFTGVRGLRAEPGRARAWQEGIDDAAAARDLTLQWCMATPADLFQTATLGRVTSIRTSGDHGYLVGPGFLWAWFCYTNALARAFGLAPFKDVFCSGGEHAEIEALLSALSTGPVGLGDAIGTTDAGVVARCCRPDGTIIRPDVPIAAVDACLRTHAVARPVPLVAECHTDHEAGRWTQVLIANTFRGETEVTGIIDLGPARPEGPIVAVDLTTGALAHHSDGWPDDRAVTLAPGTWEHLLLAPVCPVGHRDEIGVAVLGDTGKHAPVGRARIIEIAERDGRVAVTVAAPDAGGAGHDEVVPVDVVVVGADRAPEVAVTSGSGQGPAPGPVAVAGSGPLARWRVEVVAGTTVTLG